MSYRNHISSWDFTQVYSTVEKDAQINRTAQRIREIVLSRFSVYIRVFVEKNDETCRTHAEKYLHSICFQIHIHYVTFLFEKKIYVIRMKRTLYCLFKRAKDYQ